MVTGYGLIAPAIIFLTVFTFIPMALSLIWSFTEYSGIGDAKWRGFANYIEILADPLFRKSLANTVVFVLLTVSIGPALGLATALLLNRKLRGVAWYRAAFFLPVTTALVAVSTVWKLLLNQNGLINQALAVFGIQGREWLADPETALPAVAAASIWQGFGFEMVIFLAALQGVSRELHEAAQIDGAGTVRRFWHVTLPALRPTFVFVFIVGIIGGFQVFDQVYVMTGGGPSNSTITVVFYLINRFRSLDLGHVSAIAYR